MSSEAAPRGQSPHWHLLGAGHIGCLAADYLSRAGHGVTVVRDTPQAPIETTLAFPEGRRSRLRLPVIAGTLREPVTHLLVACKTPFTAEALARVQLADDAVVMRLQNGIGSLDGHLPAGARLLDAVTTSAVKGSAECHEVVAENTTWLGEAAERDRAPPVWFDALAGCWPGLRWSVDIRRRQWRKLVANAAINPLTAIHDVPNGRLVTDPRLAAATAELVAEADRILHVLDPAWPGDSLPAVQAIATATADNTSSMRADMQRGAVTEIEAINGWLLRMAERLGHDLPAHRAAVAALVRRSAERRR